jgi:tetratricopeptide (TPR) repeat protein
MNIFKHFRRDPRQPINLLDSLTDSIAKEDNATFARLVDQNRLEISDSFHDWRVAPEAIRSDPKALDLLVAVLMAIAREFQSRGDSKLIAMLQGNEDENPFAKWESALDRTKSLLSAGQYEEAIVLLLQILHESENLHGGGAVVRYLSITHGMLGQAYAQVGDLDRATEFLLKAKVACEANDDAEGLEIYTRQLGLLRSEPKVVYRLRGETMLAEPNSKEDADIQIEVVRANAIPEAAVRLHVEGRAMGSAGRYGESVSLFHQAAEIAPGWAYPWYDCAYSLLLMGDTRSALVDYKRVDALEPAGFFNSKTAIWTLERENVGDFPAGTYAAFVLMESWEPSRRQEALNKMVVEIPSFAPAWKAKAFLSDSADENMACCEMALSLDPDPETFAICMMNKASLINQRGENAMAQTMLEALIQDPKLSVGAKLVATDLLKTIAN